MSNSDPKPRSTPALAIRRDPSVLRGHTAAGAVVVLGFLWMWADIAMPELQILLPKAKWLPVAVAALGKAIEVWLHYQATGKIEIVSYSPLMAPQDAPTSLMLPEESEADTQSDPLGGDIAKNDG